MFERLMETLQSGDVPNKFTVAMGNQIKKARQELGLTQTELARNSHLRQAAISDIENGKRIVTTQELIFLGRELKKPAIYFFDQVSKGILFPEEVSPLNSELLLSFNKLNEKDQEKILTFIRTLASME